MRRMILSLAAAALLLCAPAARAAPTCQDRGGVATRCGTPGAMPVGWTAPPDPAGDPPAPGAPEPGLNTILSLVAVVGGLFALIALMPEFDGSRASDWDRQEGDDDQRRR
ncbi:MAG: hypothetical protein P4L73_20995 [Caulobacteraceae bacterium]|nr:hypothetical protein [Caulobacteraceae bacterium]